VTVVFHPEAEAEFLEAIDYYESCEPGLGHDFAIEVHSAIARIESFPAAWPSLEAGICRSLVGRFPFGVIYACDSGVIRVLAVMHLHRDPDYWKHRS